MAQKPKEKTMFASKDLTLGQINALVKKVGGHTEVLDVLSGKTTLVLQPQSKPKMLDCVATVRIPALSEFVAIDRITRRTVGADQVKISEFRAEFKKCFLYGAGKIEQPAHSFEMCISRITNSSFVSSYVDELGRNADAVISLGALYAFMQTADYAKTYLAYVESQTGSICTVVTLYDGDGWIFAAYSVAELRKTKWDPEVTLVLSRKLLAA
jgi:hypothetical protein